MKALRKSVEGLFQTARYINPENLSAYTGNSCLAKGSGKTPAGSPFVSV